MGTVNLLMINFGCLCAFHQDHLELGGFSAPDPLSPDPRVHTFCLARVPIRRSALMDRSCTTPPTAPGSKISYNSVLREAAGTIRRSTTTWLIFLPMLKSLCGLPIPKPMPTLISLTWKCLRSTVVGLSEILTNVSHCRMHNAIIVRQKCSACQRAGSVSTALHFWRASSDPGSISI